MGAFQHIRYAAKTDIGRKRSNNEDAFGVFPEAGIFCVADGMGGGDDGEVASDATVKAIGKFVQECPFPANCTFPIDGIVSGVRSAVNAASGWISRRAKEKGLKGCGSTFAGICFDAAKPDTAVSLHAGDSRLYRVRGHSIKRLTVDHSAAELMGAKDDKDINPMFRGVILRAVGIQPTVELERTEVPLKSGDKVLICSDGLSRMLNDKAMLSIVREERDLESAVNKLVDAANEAGGTDNITVELLEIGEFPAPLPTSLLVSADGVPVEENRLTSCSDTSKVDYGHGDATMTTGSGFIPSTADEVNEPESETTVNIPEDGVADGQPGGGGGGTGIPQGSLDALKRKIFVYKVLTSSLFAFSLILLVMVASIVIVRVRARANAEAKQKSIVETSVHHKEQKDSLQAVEAGRKAAAEQRERDEEFLKARATIQTPEKQMELAEKARKAVKIREREEAAAREAARQDELRKAEERRQQQEREEAEAREVARQEELRKAEEQRQRQEREAAEARQEELRKAEEQRQQQEAARALEAEQNQVIKLFSDVVKNGDAGKFYAKVKQLIPKSFPENLYQKFSQTVNNDLTRSEKIEAIIALTKDIQQVMVNLREYSVMMLDIVKSDLADETSSEVKRKSDKMALAGIEEFVRQTDVFVRQEASAASAQKTCVTIIRSVPKWFDF